MAGNHELDPSLSSGDVFDCSRCGIAGELMGYLESMQGLDSRDTDHSEMTTEGTDSYRLTKAQREKLRSILRVSPDLGAFAIEIQRLKVCPMILARDEHPEIVAQLVSVGLCESFDMKYRPGIDTTQE